MFSRRDTFNHIILGTLLITILSLCPLVKYKAMVILYLQYNLASVHLETF